LLASPPAVSLFRAVLLWRLIRRLDEIDILSKRYENLLQGKDRGSAPERASRAAGKSGAEKILLLERKALLERLEDADLVLCRSPTVRAAPSDK